MYSITFLTTVFLVFLAESTPCSLQGINPNPLRQFFSPFIERWCTWSVENYSTVVNAGDLLMIWPTSTPMQLARTFHWAYALTDTQLFHFFVHSLKDTHGEGRIGNIDKYKSRGVYSMGPNPREYPRLQIEDSYALAHRLVGLKLHYDALFCNCRHYVDYVVYGKTFGEWWKRDLSGLPICKACPLHRTITTETNIYDEEFYLEDGGQNQYKMKTTSDEVSQEAHSKLATGLESVDQSQFERFITTVKQSALNRIRSTRFMEKVKEFY